MLRREMRVEPLLLGEVEPSANVILDKRDNRVALDGGTELLDTRIKLHEKPAIFSTFPIFQFSRRYDVLKGFVTICTSF